MFDFYSLPYFPSYLGTCKNDAFQKRMVESKLNNIFDGAKYKLGGIISRVSD